MHKGGFVSEEGLRESTEKLKERPSWWLLDGKIVHCRSWELPMLKELLEKRNKYELTDEIEEASHWLAKEDENNYHHDITVGKYYDLSWDEKEYEYHVIDDKGVPTLVFLVHEGDFVIKITE